MRGFARASGVRGVVYRPSRYGGAWLSRLCGLNAAVVVGANAVMVVLSMSVLGPLTAGVLGRDLGMQASAPLRTPFGPPSDSLI